MAIQIQLRRGTASQWTTANTLLAQGEVGLETDTNKFKFGDGVTTWNSLAYYPTGTVTSVGLSGGTTGLTTSGSPITTTGTITLAGTLAVANGGTGQTSYTDGQLLIGNSTGNTLTKTTLTAGSGIAITNGSGSISIAATNSGTVTSVTATSPVASTGGATPVISMPAATTSVSGYLSSADWTTFNNKGSGTVTSVTGTSPVASSGGATPAISLSAGYGDTLNPYASKTANFVLAAPNGSAGVPTFRAVVASDIPTLNQNTTGSAATLTTGRTLAITGDLAYTSTSFDGSANVTAAGTLATVNTNVGSFTNATLTVNGKGLITAASSGTAPVTSVTATSPVLSSGGATPDISIPAATTSVSGYLTSTDWTTFNSKGSGTVTSVAATVPSFLSVSGSPITTSGTLAITLSGTALPIANGGTGETTLAGASIATYSGTETLTNKRIDPRVTSAASASSLTPDISASDVYAYTALAAGLTINAPTGTPLDGDKLIFRLLDNGTSRALTWNATYTVIGVTLPTATTISKTTYVGCIYNANNTRWDVIAVTTQA